MLGLSFSCRILSGFSVTAIWIALLESKAFAVVVSTSTWIWRVQADLLWRILRGRKQAQGCKCLLSMVAVHVSWNSCVQDSKGFKVDSSNVFLIADVKVLIKVAVLFGICFYGAFSLDWDDDSRLRDSRLSISSYDWEAVFLSTC